jgi:predicted neuraminidase
MKMARYGEVAVVSVLVALPMSVLAAVPGAPAGPAAGGAAAVVAVGSGAAAATGPAATGPGVDEIPAGARGQKSTYPEYHIAKILKAEMLYEKAPFPSCHASTIVETPAGFVAAYFGGTAERNPDVCIWVSRNIDGKWLAPENVANGVLETPVNGTNGQPMSRVATWNPVLFQPKEGPLYLFYKVGPAPSLWWGEFKTSTDNGKTWSKATKLPEGTIGPVKDKPIQLEDGTIVSGSSTEGTGGSHVHMELSTDNCKTWTRLANIPGPSAIQPTVMKYALPDGGVKLQILCRTSADVLVESWSLDKGKTWSDLKASKLPNPGSGVDAVTLADGRQVLAYNPTKRADPNKGRMPLNLAVSKDGIDWKDVLTLDNAMDQGQFSYPAIIQAKDGRIHVTYTYGRKTIKYVVVDEKSF